MIVISVKSMPFSSGSDFSPKTNTVKPGATLSLKSGSSDSILVYTLNADGDAFQAFTAGQPPYTATADGASFTLVSGLAGSVITLSIFPPGSGPVTGANGTINVGGGDPDDAA